MNSVEILERLVSFPTVSRDTNLGLIDYVKEYLAARGTGARLYMDASGAKANLFASVGPADRGGVLLSGHTDVVPVDGQRWSTAPFELRAKGERLYARGSADMKGFLACALRAVDRASARELKVPLQLAFSYDEEIGCVGVHSLIEDMQRWSFRPRLCIVGEPTMLTPAVGHKGKTALKATCRGRAAHSSRPAEGVNAIYMASGLIERLRLRQRELAASGAHDPAYEVPHTTLHVGVIQGGTALNIVPTCCELELEFRNLPADDPAGLMKAIRADAQAVVESMQGDADTGIDIEPVYQYPALETPADSEVVGLAAALTGNRERIKVSFGTEGGLFSERLGIPTVVCGPGSIEQAHKPDEFVTRDQLARCDAMLDALIERLA